MDDLDREITLAYGMVGNLKDAIGLQLDELIIEAQLARDSFDRGMMPKNFIDRASSINKMVVEYQMAKKQLETLKALKESLRSLSDGKQ